MIGILRYSAGNVGSVQRALTRLQIPSKIIEDSKEFETISGLIFPGAGAAGAAMENLREKNLIEPLKKYQKPFLGLCLGMQLFFEYSEEDNTDCLGLIEGKVQKIQGDIVVPHMGWNLLSLGAYAYFMHSFVCSPEDPSVITMTTSYGTEIRAGIQKRNLFGLQWHPEKSGDIGDRYLLAFSKICE